MMEKCIYFYIWKKKFVGRFVLSCRIASIIKYYYFLSSSLLQGPLAFELKICKDLVIYYYKMFEISLSKKMGLILFNFDLIYDSVAVNSIMTLKLWVNFPSSGICVASKCKCSMKPSTNILIIHSLLYILPCHYIFGIKKPKGLAAENSKRNSKLWQLMKFCMKTQF